MREPALFRNRRCQGYVVALLVLSAVAVGLAAGAEPLWQSRGQPEFAGSALALAASGNVVVAAGNVCTTASIGSCNWFVRAVDATAGVTLWEDRLNVGGFDRSQGVAVDGDRVFASGWFATPATGFDFVVRAYDLHSGTPLWQQRIHRQGFSEFAEIVGARGNRVFAAGRVLGPSGSSDFTLFAFEASTGALLWESVTDPSGLGLLDVAFALDDHGTRVFAVGPVNSFSGLLVRAHDAKTGRVLWEDEIAGGTQFVRARQLATQGGLLFVAGGVLTASGDQDLLVRAYDQLSGSVRWSHQEDAGGNDEVFALDVSGNRLLAAGGDGCDASFLSCYFAVRQLDPHSGALVWRDAFQDAPGADAYAVDLTSAGRHAYIGGAVQNADGAYQWALRAYDTGTGAVVWDERLSEGPDGGVNAVASAGNRLYAAGTLPRSDFGSDFVVRAYSLTKQ